MKKTKKLLMIVITIMIGLVLMGVNSSLSVKETESSGLEALSQGEAIITCDSGDYGQCHIYAYDVQLGGLIIYHYCKWTGKQDDYCPITVYLLNNGNR